ncbi:ligninase H2 [Xylariaceae sp. FL1272]|nr:ligninase H2 [Xylariaceae sp. FL1272]
MIPSNILFSCLALSGLPVVISYPGWGKQLEDLVVRQEGGGGDEFDSFELLGDLQKAPDSQLTPVGQDIKSLLTGGGDPESDVTWTRPALGSTLCRQDICCVWDHGNDILPVIYQKLIKDDMYAAFKSKSGRCNGLARAAVRLGFHDAGAWSKEVASQGGGADGSICINDVEINQPENNGLQTIVKQMQKWYQKWNIKKGYTQVTYADLIQMGATIATVTCPLGPRVKSYVGRKDSSFTNHFELLPSAADSADHLIALFKNKTIFPHGLTALVGAHTSSQQFFFNTSRAGDPQDSTPGVWDVKFYNQTLFPQSAPKRVLMFPSDLSLSVHPDTHAEWVKFTVDQEDWNEDFAREYIRLSLLGVNNINNLTECTKVLPPAIRNLDYKASDEAAVASWLKTTSHNVISNKIADLLNSGGVVLASLLTGL